MILLSHHALEPGSKMELHNDTMPCFFVFHCNLKTELKYKYIEYELGTKQHISRQSTRHIDRHQFIAWKGDTDTT